MSTTNETTDENFGQPAIRFSTRFWIYLPFLVPSIIACIFVLYHLISNRSLRSAPKNHVNIILLFISLLMEVALFPGMLYYYWLDGHWDRPYYLCLIWGYVDYTLCVMPISMMALASVQRHILIFHERWMSSKIKRCFVHYIPILIILIFYPTFYAVIFLFPPCGYVYMYSGAACMTSCMWNEDPIFNYYDSIANQILPVFTLTLFNMLLIVRVIRQKYRMNQRVQWRKHRKMAVQFLLISSVYIIFALPYGLVLLLYFSGMIYDWYGLSVSTALVMSYMPYFFMPLMCSVALPEIRQKFWNLIPFKRHTAVVPMQGFSVTVKSRVPTS